MTKRFKSKTAGSRIRLAVSLTTIALCLAAVGIGLFVAGRSRSPVAVRIDALDVDLREYRLIAEEERTDVLAELTSRWGVEADAAFWQTERDGITPAGELERRTIERLTVIKAEQQMMQEAGILESADYAAFYDDWQEENRRRQEASSRGEVLYGPVSYTEKQYYTKRLDQGRMALQEQLSAGQLAVTEAERRAFYEQEDEEFLFEGETRKPLDQVASVIDKRLVEIKYEQLVAQRAQAAQVTVYRNVLDNIRYG